MSFLKTSHVRFMWENQVFTDWFDPVLIKAKTTASKHCAKAESVAHLQAPMNHLEMLLLSTQLQH